MKRVLFLLLPLSLAVACNKVAQTPIQHDNPDTVESCQLNITVDGEGAMTKASAYTNVLPHEKEIKSLQLLVFNSVGMIEKYARITGTTYSLTVSQGTKHIYAFANCQDLSHIVSIDGLGWTNVSLEEWTSSTGLPMHGDADVICVANTTKPCNIELKRYTARVALTEISVRLPSAISMVNIGSVFLTNVVCETTLTPGGEKGWCNIQGRNQDGDTICWWNGIDADCPEHTYETFDYNLFNGNDFFIEDDHDYPFLGYTFANNSTVSPYGASNFDPSTGERTCLVVELYVEGMIYYYPIVLDNGSLDENCAYTVSLTITGLGSTDPDIPVQKGSLSGTITVSNWKNGAVYEKTI